MDQSGDLLIIVPSRGRPQNIARLMDAVHETRRLDTHLHVAVDDDDPELSRYQYIMKHAGLPGDQLITGERDGLTGWTNSIAVSRAEEYPFLASFGDDHLPRTKGFDKALTRAIADFPNGTGFAYPWDGTREDVPEACVMSSNIVQALGWMMLPDLKHFWVDNVWADLGTGAGCIRHLRAVAVDHLHPGAKKANGDRTYAESGKKIPEDRKAYFAWRNSERFAEDIKAILDLSRELQLA